MRTADEVADELIELLRIDPIHHNTLVQTLLDYAATSARAWGEHEWTSMGNTIRFGPAIEDHLIAPGDGPGIYRIIAAHEATRRRVAIAESLLEDIHKLSKPLDTT